MTYSQQDCIVKTSKGYLYIFYIINENLMIKEIDKDNKIESILFKEGVSNYALDIDNSDIIHILYLSKSGSVNYTTYPQTDSPVEIDSLTKALPIKYLTIKALDSGIHIFYRTNNLYKNTGFICHNFLHNNNLENKLLLQTTSPRYICPYFIDYYDKNIYLLYCSDYKKHKYILKKFSVENNSWQDFEDYITIESVNNLNFFTTPHNTAVLAYDNLNNNNMEILLRYKDLNSKKSSWSKDICVSAASSNILNLILFYENRKLHIMWNENNSISYKTSKDFLNWKKKSVVNQDNMDIDLYTYVSNDCENISSKINNIYFSSKFNSINMQITEDLDSQATPLSLSLDEPEEKDKSQISSKNTSVDNSNTNILNKNEEITSNLSVIMEKDKVIAKLEEKNLILEKELQALYKIIQEYKNNLTNQKSEHYIENRKLQSELTTYRKEILSLREEKHKLYTESNKKNQELFKIIEEKEKLLRDLWQITSK